MGQARDLLWVLEQLPGRVARRDLTPALLQQSYWASYNRAFFPDIHRVSGGGKMEADFGDWFSYTRTPRARIFAEEQAGVTSAAALLSDQTGPGPATRLLVVPAFESNQYLSSGRLPGTKAELVARLDLGEVAPFRWREWPRGHAPTNFPRWRTATLPYTVAWQQDFEPYIVGARAALPRYDTR